MLVSVIIPCYNVEAYVARALDSALAQTYRPLEIIAVDNNSTDDTLAILRQYEQRYPELITVLQEPKQGAPAARNLGLRHAKGEWLQFLDADDVILPGKVDGQVGLIKAGNANAVLIMGSYFIYPLKGKPYHSKPIEDPLRAIISGNASITTANLWQANAVKEVGYWDETREMVQEYELMLRILTNNLGTTVADMKPRSQIYKRENSISTSDKRRHLYESSIISLKACNHCLSLASNFSDDMLQYAKQSLIKYLAILSLHNRRQALDMYRDTPYRPSQISSAIMSRSFTIPYRYLGFKPAIYSYALAMWVRNIIGLNEE